jgi:acetyl-CoA carboxylase biotin carboxyl carrier protein
LNFKEILELIDKVADTGIGSLEVEQAGVKIRIEGKSIQPTYIPAFAPSPQQEIPMMAAMPQQGQLAAASQPAAAALPAAPDPSLHIITSPIVGTFYRTPNPEAPAFVNVGDRIQKGQVLCIVEAMKLMNEIESDIDGVITEIFPQNGQPVEYGENLFAVKM